MHIIEQIHLPFPVSIIPINFQHEEYIIPIMQSLQKHTWKAHLINE